jgi:hypothetical protein
MSVIWTGKGEAMDAIGLAVACHLCGVTVGEPCTTRVFPLTRGLKTHIQRHDLAEAFGFVLTGAPPAPKPAPAPARAAPEPDLFA